ncbi:ABC transporter substrate-binding protein [Gilliamella sp. B3486]|nr:ABC transporter substrate-binding protein [Gilliamella sp. B3562]MCX8597042.1 ABC transporter substrate-binding protein [Gilliamella sp. B3493]MCX8600133.1 ABC transporter substrate-binding protein [Gilliamella sp. B3486]MCX8661291.1 ABC transporter substrate-binding protein [Gilliamella sp. B2772]MCX8663224.1 ABC transporter substrate-binding protein [Gilliamella sp. B2911]MCX8671536.1 ABC transporter substrate-binding protein [Gilliamella sp. B2785]MCX8674652.1 ABC transporter substrate-
MLLSLSVVTFFSLADNKSEQKYVAITAIVEHPALDNVRKGVEDELKDNGYIVGQNLKLQFASAQGSSANAAQIAKQFVANKPNVIVGIATPSTQALVATTKTIPIVFTAVTDPVAAKLTPSWEASKTNVTGVSDALSLESQIDMMLKIKPDAKNIGYVYSPSEVNSTIVLKELQVALGKRGMKIIAAPAQRTSDISTAAISLKGKVDLIYTTTDNNVVSAYEALAKVANENKIPLLASDPDSAERGAIAALGMSYYDLGRQAGKIVIRILNGEKPGDIPPQVGNITQLTINKKAAERQGVTLSEEVLKSAAKIVEK